MDGIVIILYKARSSHFVKQDLERTWVMIEVISNPLYISEVETARRSDVIYTESNSSFLEIGVKKSKNLTECKYCG